MSRETGVSAVNDLGDSTRIYASNEISSMPINNSDGIEN